MRSISSGLATHLEGEVTTLATCWKLTRRDGEVMGFTSADRTISFESVTYLAASGFVPSPVEASAGLAVNNLDLEGILDSEAITAEDVLAGKYDFAEVEIFLLNYENTAQGSLSLSVGWLGEVTLEGGKFVAEVRGLSQKLSTHAVGGLYAPACRAQLGDSRCKVDLEAFTFTGSVTSVTSRQVFADSSRNENSGYFTLGVVTFTSGANNGQSMEVKAYESGTFTLALPVAFMLETGDGYSVTAGCDKSFTACIGKFENAVNFRGEPHVPGWDRMLETAGTKSNW